MTAVSMDFEHAHNSSEHNNTIRNKCFTAEFLYHIHFVVRPKGIKLIFISLQCALAKGIPIMVIAKMQARIRCTTAISHHPQRIQSTEKPIDRQPALSFAVTSLPKGASARTPIFISCTPKGMPIIVMHISSPATKYIRATRKPPKINHRIFPRLQELQDLRNSQFLMFLQTATTHFVQ